MERFVTHLLPDGHLNREQTRHVRGQRDLRRANRLLGPFQDHQRTALTSFRTTMEKAHDEVKDPASFSTFRRFLSAYAEVANDYHIVNTRMEGRKTYAEISIRTSDGVEVLGLGEDSVEKTKILLGELNELNSKQSIETPLFHKFLDENRRKDIIEQFVEDSEFFKVLGYLELIGEADSISPEVFRGNFTPEQTARYITCNYEPSVPVSQKDLAIAGDPDAMAMEYTDPDLWEVMDRRAILFGYNHFKLRYDCPVEVSNT